jgi:hypothetical protein
MSKHGIQYTDMELITAFGTGFNRPEPKATEKSYSVVYSNNDVRYVYATGIMVARTMASEYGVRMLNGAKALFVSEDHG